MNATDAPTISRICDFSITYPGLPQLCINREHLLQPLESMFKRGIDVVVIEGDEQIGKTTILAQYCSQRPKTAFCLFIRSFPDIAFEPDLLRYDLANQINWFLTGTTLNPEQIITGPEYRILLARLLKTAERSGEILYFVVDGLTSIPDRFENIRQLILEMLPIGYKYFRCLLSANDSSNLDLNAFGNIQVKPYPLPPFSPDEARHYLSDFRIPVESLQGVLTISRSIPGHLASLRRLLEDGTDVEEILSSHPNSVPDLFRVEWRKVNQKDELLIKCLAALAFARHITRLGELSIIVGADEQTISAKLKLLRFISIDTNAGSLKYVHDSFLRYAAEQLKEHEVAILDRVIDVLAGNPTSEQALRALPSYLEKKGDFKGIINYLNPDNLVAALDQSHSILAVIDKTAAAKLAAHNAPDLIAENRYALFQTLLRRILKSTVRRSELLAHLAQNDLTAALQIANSTYDIEQRLHLLALIAKHQKKQGQDVDPALVEQISALATQVRAVDIPDKCTGIAAELLFPLPKIAFELLGRAYSNPKDPNALEYAAARLYHRTLTEQFGADDKLNVVQQITSNIKTEFGEEIRSLANALLPEKDSASFLKDVASLSQTTQKIFLGRTWLRINYAQQGACKVAVELLNSMIADAAYSPNAAIYRDLVLPLSGKDPDVTELKALIEAQLGSIMKVGPTVEYYRVQAALFIYEWPIDGLSAITRILQCMDEMSSLDDIATKAASYAWTYAAVRLIDPKEEAEAEWGIHKYLRDAVFLSVNKLLIETASHTEAISNIIEALSACSYSNIETIIRDVNTEYRRDALWVHYIKALTTSDRLTKFFNDYLENVERGISSIKDIDQRAIAAKLFIDWFLSSAQQLPSTSMAGCTAAACKYLAMIDAADARAVYASRVLSKGKKLQWKPEHLELARKIMFSAWLEIDTSWIRRQVAFEIIANVVDELTALNAFFFKEPEFAISERPIADYAATISIQLAALLARIYAHLLPLELITSLDMRRAERIIEDVQSTHSQASLWSFIALRIGKKNAQLATDIARNKLLPLLEQLEYASSRDNYVYRIIIERVAPALWLINTAIATHFLDQLSLQDRDIAYSNIVDYLLKGKIPQERYSNLPDETYELTFDEALLILGVIEKLEDDACIWLNLSTILRSINSQQKNWRLSRDQRAQIVLRVRKIVSAKLPNPRFIKHEGFAVLIEAELLAVERADVGKWTLLINRIVAIPNVSDRAFMYSMILPTMSGKATTLKKSVLDSAIEIIEKLPTRFERLDRSYALAKYVKHDFTIEAKKLIESALKETKSSDQSEDIIRRRKEFIDQAYTIDAGWAEALASLSDDDPARVKTKNTRETNQIASKRLVDSILREGCGSNIEAVKIPILAAATKELMGKINTTHVSDLTYKDVTTLFNRCGDASIDATGDIYKFGIEALITKYAERDQAQRYIRPYFDMVIESADLVSRILKSSGMPVRVRPLEAITERQVSSTVPIGLGERDHALSLVREWLSTDDWSRMWLIDPYFSESDMDAITLVHATRPTAKLHVLTSIEHQKAPLGSDLEQHYNASWKRQFPDIPVPDVAFTFVAFASDGRTPIHERFWITDNGGIRFGTSYNGLGVRKKSEIELLNKIEADARLKEYIGYFDMSKRSDGTERLRYITFVLL